MDKMVYTNENIERIRSRILDLFDIVAELEEEFPGRHFTLDGHLVGSIGEVLAAYYYGIKLYTSSAETHDGIVNGKEVQIKITQRDTVLISSEPAYLIVLYLTKKGEVYEVYNGRGSEPWNSTDRLDSHNNKHLRVNKLMKLDTDVPVEDRIPAIYPIEKMKKEFGNK